MSMLSRNTRATQASVETTRPINWSVTETGICPNELCAKRNRANNVEKEKGKKVLQ
tara:strand:+ start:575 stop:742 length:168 start_codon:yes stop_codon:yes gene_type:complete